MLPKCNVLLIEDSPDSAMLVNHFLGASKIADFDLVIAPTLKLARERLVEERFDAILLDLNLPDSRGLETFKRVREGARGAAIVILTAVEDEGVATTAIGHGAADYLIKGEVGGEGLARRIRFAVERNRAGAPPEPARASRIVVVLGAKGGSGASTMAINLAAAYSRREKNVVLLELRPSGGTLATLLNVTSALTIDSLAELGGPQTLEASTGKLPFGPRLLAAPPGLPGVTAWEPQAVGALLDKAATTADWVIVDATATIPDLLKAAVAKAWFTLLVVEREPISVTIAGRKTPAIAGWNRPNALGAALVNHMPFMESAPLPSLRAELGCGIVGVLPPAREVLQSYRRQGPIVLAQPNAPVSVAFDDIATRIDHDPVQFQLQ